ncbi:MAG: 16S rRNA (uracil(1498)-N(3))-methyltransferase [Cyanomargarita calcarea GSE-NOS-MK-12-04C]|jgi:16S rRNA (uracil1498-N3)-methyltransferase|uniref:Ribosomal RNA small subunit methyltransferase E n=1 Tax=Cyanomargarita calcarea GSE-NOS-MK-12-04C TaxID=2839659 RepID=A0A951UT11_9CYAN|nr:16S rRNA (uracil(1498)-N(3))-methyltransferase [Cyanomargarita calcarea GSE-NOS-MK-12-04C]
MSQLQRIAIAQTQLQESKILLTPEQLHYLVRVLRLREGDRFIAMDGMGKWWLAILAGEQAEVLEAMVVETELPVAITLLVALPKGNGFDDVVRMSTELGVVCIAPVTSDRTLLNPSPQKLERWRRIATEAAEQSERAIVPTILEPVAFSTALSLFATYQKYICEGRGNYPHLKKCLEDQGKMLIVIAIGPEGGWTEAEVEKAVLNGFQAVSLGRRILRAVTAPIVALSLISAICEV